MRLPLAIPSLAAAVLLGSTFFEHKVQSRTTFRSVERAVGQQEVAQEPPDYFDEGAKQPQSTYDPASDRDRDLLGRMHQAPEGFYRTLIQRVQTQQVLDVRETATDSGPEVDQYLRFCGVNEPAWWCAAFVSFQIHEAAREAHFVTRWRKLALCDDIFLWARKHRLLLATPVVPSVMLIPGDAPGYKLYKHVGIVVAYDPATATIKTVEGNSNNDGSHNGIGVFKQTRHVDKCMRFVKIV